MPSGARSLARGVISSARVQKAYFTDSFDRANGALASPDWTVIQANLTVNSNQVQGSGGFALYGTGCQTDDEFAQVTIGSVATGQIGLYVRCPSTGWPQPLAQFTPSSGAWTIITDPSSAGSNHTTRASGSVGSGVWVTGGTLRFEAVGNVYTLKYNGTPVPSATWTDSGAVITPGPTKRRVGVQIFSGSFRIDDFVGGDL